MDGAMHGFESTAESALDEDQHQHADGACGCPCTENTIQAEHKAGIRRRLSSLNLIPGKELMTVDNFSQLVSTILAAFCKMGDAEFFEEWTLSATSQTLLTTCLHAWLNHTRPF